MNFSGLFFEGLPSGRGRASVGLGRFTQLARFARLGIMAGVVGAMVGTTGCGSSAATAVDTNQPGMGTLTTATTLALTGSVTATTPQAATLTNSSSATVKILGISISGTNASNFSQTNTCGTQVLAANACTVTVSFTATAPGSYSATLTISTDSTTNGTVTVALTGVATLTQLTQSASSLSFPLMVAGSGSTPQILTLTNSGTVPVTLGSIAISGAYASAFSDTTTCGASLAVSATCTVTVSFASTTTATDTATLSIANSASTGGSATVALTGSAAVPTVSLSASSLSFPLMTAGSASTPQTVTLSNTGTVPVTLGSIAIGGTNASAFSITTKTCGTTLAIAGSCTVTLSYSDAAAASDVATLLIVNNTASNPVTVALSGSTSAPVLNLSSVSLSFPLMVAGSASTPQVVTLTNNGTVPVTLGSIAIGGSNPSAFSITTNTCGSSLAVSGNCAVTINFASATTATDTATLTIANSASTGGSATVALTGSAAVPTISQSATSLTFPLMVSGSGSTPQIVTLTNNGTVSTTLGAITLGGANASAFSKTTTCGTSLAVSATCTVTLSYTEAATASDSATLSIANNSASPLVTVALAGSAAVPTVSLSANSLSFASVTTGSGTTTSTATVTLTNNGTVPLTLSGTTITGTNANLFSVSQTTCGSSLAVAGNCTVTMIFAPIQGGTDTATLSIADNTSAGSEIVGLSSTAIGSGVTLSSNAITFTSIVAGISSTTTATVTLQNTGTTALTLSGIAMSVINANAFTQTNTCGTTVAANASCVITMKFAPLVSGSYTATMTLTDNAGAGTQTVSLTAAATPFVITLNNSSSTWTIDNGAITFQWSSSSGNLISWILDGYADQLIDTAYSSDGLYMDNAGFGTGSNVNAKATWGPNKSYLDWQITNASSTTNAYSATEHWIVYPNDPGVHVYIELVHATTDIAGSVGQVQWVFRDNTSLLPNTYEVNPSLTGLGVEDVTLPSQSDLGSSAAGRSVENAVEDLHGFNNFPSNWTREFYTKYDFAGYEYLHQAHGVYGPNYGVWTVLNNKDTFVGGPTKQNLFFTENIDMIEAFSDHEDEPLTTLATATGVASTRLFGPYYIHVNRFGKAYTQTESPIATQADMYADAIAAGAALAPLYDNDTVLTTSGYVVSTARGSVSINMSGIPSGLSPYTAWAVLSDPGVNYQVSSLGYQYWADISANGSATITGVVPGTYRVSVYVLGQWGEFRQDGVVVTANGTTTFTGTWVPENFAGTNETTVFTIGTPDRSAHEFLHGHTSDGKDDRENLGAWNYWADFAANNGAVVYYATAVGSTPATNDLTKWNYNHWGYFDPGLYAAVYGTGSDVSTDGYIYAIPSYVAGLSTETGTNGVTTPIPAWQIHFATPANYTSYSSGYAVLSVAVACTEGSYVIYLNNHEEIWHYSHASDCQMRSGLSGYTQWFVMQWPVSDLIQSVGGDNLITISMSTQDGSSDDAMRMELTNTSAVPATRGWYDYSYIWGNGSSSYSYPNDAQANP